MFILACLNALWTNYPTGVAAFATLMSKRVLVSELWPQYDPQHSPWPHTANHGNAQAGNLYACHPPVRRWMAGDEARRVTRSPRKMR